jgi:hypothetical protein
MITALVAIIVFIVGFVAGARPAAERMMKRERFKLSRRSSDL